MMLHSFILTKCRYTCVILLLCTKNGLFEISQNSNNELKKIIHFFFKQNFLILETLSWKFLFYN